MVVIPIVAVLCNPVVLDELKASEREVARMFVHPLRALLEPDCIQGAAFLSAKGSEDWPHGAEVHVRH